MFQPTDISRAELLALTQQSEKDFQADVIEVADRNGWKYYHPHRSDKSVKGFPDLTMIRGYHLIAAELKTSKGIATVKQQEWLDAYRMVRKVDSYLWRPENIDEIEELLR